jgi:hypothetical protein
MTHLKPAEIIDAPRTRQSDRQRHLAHCVRCRDQVRDAIEMLAEVKLVPHRNRRRSLGASFRQRPRHDQRTAFGRADSRVDLAPTAVATAVVIVIGLSFVTRQPEHSVATSVYRPAEPPAVMPADDGS